MIKKFLSKYILEVIPSIFATVVGAYIVTHYINAKSDADKPKAAISAPAETSRQAAPPPLKADDSTAKSEAAKSEAAKSEAAKSEAVKAEAAKSKAAEKAAEKGASDKAAVEKLASDKASADKAATAKASVQREKTIAKTTPAVTPAAEANAAPDEKRDANDIARAAIERLRNAEPRQADTPRASEPARLQDRAPERARMNSVVYAPAAASQPPAMQPLPPAVTVAPPQSEAAIVAPPAPFPVPASGASDARLDDSSRLTPPEDIPSRPLDLRARTGRTSVAEDVVSAAKSVFHAVVPEPTN